MKRKNLRPYQMIWFYLCLSQVLCLNHNHVESVIAKPKATSPANAPKRGTDFSVASEITNPENFTPVLPNLEVLHLG